MVVSTEDESKQALRTSFRWEVVAAGICFLIFWLDVSRNWIVSRALPPGEIYNRLAFDVPFLILTPALAFSALRNPRASRLSRWSAGGILVGFLFNDCSWYVVRMIIHAASY
jgi:hypothetical protein